MGKCHWYHPWVSRQALLKNLKLTEISIGDVIDAFMAVMVMRTCQQVEGGLPSSVKSKMMFNIMLDFVIGLVPFIGDLADAVFRANTRNAVELERYLREKGAKNIKAQGQSAGGVLDPSDPDEYDRQLRAEHGEPPQYQNVVGNDTVPAASTQQTAGGQHQPSTRSSSGWGGAFGKKRTGDVEQGTSVSTQQTGTLPAAHQDRR